MHSLNEGRSFYEREGVQHGVVDVPTVEFTDSKVGRCRFAAGHTMARLASSGRMKEHRFAPLALAWHTYPVGMACGCIARYHEHICNSEKSLQQLPNEIDEYAPLSLILL